ncbi:hypothetical protein OYC64_006821 [Pagothenia borchgrevinki]|uniref:Uncharacterized protein n=1 Tax=Pagothenia borchgrevinki TaxID=8213 RepID=A0ABD2G336_PAGBO
MYADWLHHGLVRQLHRPHSYGFTEAGENCTDNITRTELPSMEDLYSQRLRKKSLQIIKDPHHPSHKLFCLLLFGRRYRSIRTKTTRFRDSFIPQAIRLLNN